MKASSNGGSSDELGSLHRNGAAAVLAVYGLVGAEVAGNLGAVPIRLHLEADTAVDDIACEMQSGASWFIQCKRTAGHDNALRAAARQWALQSIQAADRVVLIARDLRGILRNLQPTIDRERGGRSVPLGKEAQKNLNTFIEVLESEGSKDGHALLSHVELLRWATEQSSDAQQAHAEALLGGTVVKTADARTAFEALRGFMQHQAAQREWSTVGDWIRVLTDAHIEVFLDLDGEPGPRAAASISVLSAYRKKIAAGLDVLDLSLLAPNLGSVQADKLLDAWDVEFRRHVDETPTKSHSLWDVTRRNPRLCVTGHPGIGKSVALRQIAARMAADPTAPLPILIDLREGLGPISRADDVSMALLLTKPREVVSTIPGADMQRVLEQALATGNVTLIVDGLDETRRRRGTVALAFHQILRDVHPDVGFILSTRPSAADALETLDLPTVELRPPKGLSATLAKILEELAQRIPSSRRSAWLETRQATLDNASRSASEVWKIPLLATLAVLRIGSDRPAARTVSELLEDVITESISSWEELKAKHRDDLDKEMRSENLTEGFTALGRLLWDIPRVPIEQAVSEVEHALLSWGHSPPLRRVLAEEVVHFWDERVGIFVNVGGELVPRNRQFTELATVTWLRGKNSEEKREWLYLALADQDRSRTVELATAEDPVLRAHLVASGARSEGKATRQRATTWLADQWPTWNDLAEETSIQAVHVLADAAEDELSAPADGDGAISWIVNSRRRYDGGGWNSVLALVRRHVEGPVRIARDAQLEGLTLSPDRRTLVNLLAALTDASHGSRALSVVERIAVEEFIFGPIPRPSTSSTDADGVLHIERREFFLTGVDDVLKLAATHVSEFRAEAPAAFYEAARRSSPGTYEHVAATLERLGFPDPNPPTFSTGVFRALERLQETFQDFYGAGWMLRLLNTMSLRATDTCSPVEIWRRRELLRFLDSITWGRESIPEWRAASQENKEVLTPWFNAVIATYGLDRNLLGIEARTILADPTNAFDMVGLASAPDLNPQAAQKTAPCEVAVQLAPCFASSSDWIARQAFLLTIEAKCPDFSVAIAAIDEPMNWHSRFLATSAAIANSDDLKPWIDRCSSGDSSERSALAMLLPSLDVTTDLLAQLATDEDATVRHYAKGDGAGAVNYTCTHCYKIRQIDEVPCPVCKQAPEWKS